MLLARKNVTRDDILEAVKAYRDCGVWTVETDEGENPTVTLTEVAMLGAAGAEHRLREGGSDDDDEEDGSAEI